MGSELNSSYSNIFSEVDIFERDPSELNFNEIFNLEEIQKLQDTFASVHGVASLITDTRGLPITRPSNFSYLCNSIIRQNQKGNERCCNSDSIIGKTNPEGPNVQKCLSAGLWDGGTSIMLGDKHIASWLIGQVIVEPCSEEELMKYAEFLGVDENEYLEALGKIPRMSEKKFREINQILFHFAKQLSELALKNFQLIQELEKRRKAELKTNSLYSVARAVNSAESLEAVFENANDLLSKIIYFENFLIAKYHKESDEVSFRYSSDENYPFNDLRDSKSLALEVIRKEKPVHLKQGEIMSILSPEGSSIQLCREFLGVPLKIKGELLGVLCFRNFSREAEYSKEDIEILEAVSEQMAIAVKHKQSEEKLKEAKEIAERSERLKTEFLAQISHEIRTPLNAILSFNALIRQEIENKIQGEIQEGFNIIERGSKRIIRTIDLLLNMSAVQTGNYDVCLTEVNIDETLRLIIREFTALARQKKLALKIENSSKQNVIFADGYTITQIFTNLIDNALKFTNAGGVSVRIFDNSKGKMSVEVRDTGIGMSKEFLPNLFKPFLQEEMGYTRRYEGNGLGLALVKKYCELNNAEIKVESEKKKGSTFTVIFG
ncbi:MAG TPA: PocR ligand-binding domain-containing protein [Ignavibacteriales bacterium]|nr:PocR ligand-binding domain-containing protein [Ignavibacteriales bacterium]